MRFTRVRLQYFRNTHFLELPFEGLFQFFLGPNGQGKTNILEALGYISTLRSFRTPDSKCLINDQFSKAQIFYQIDHEQEGPCEILLSLSSSGQRTLEFNGQKISKVSQLIGLFPTVVLSSEDIQWLRGAPLYRRKFLDLSLSSVDPFYLKTLKQYHKALQERNSLLKSPHKPDKTLLEAYDTLLSPLAFHLYQKRITLIKKLNTLLLHYYYKITHQDHSPQLLYNPDLELNNDQAYLEILKKNITRDQILKSTQKGPHRDDFSFKHAHKLAKSYASEGQQRALVIALRLAQAQFFQETLNINPVILADDILGQLDPEKYQNFWTSLNPSLQLIATATSAPPKSSPPCQLFHVYQGSCAQN